MYEDMSSIVVDTVARLGAVSLALRLNGPLVFITTVVIILVHLHLTSGGLQMGLLRLRLRWWLRLNRCRSLGRRLRLGLRAECVRKVTPAGVYREASLPARNK